MTPVRQASFDDAKSISALAVETFGLACPPDMAQADVEAFTTQNLSPERFEAYLSDSTHVLLVAQNDETLLGYTLLIDNPPTDPVVDEAVTARPAVELNKVYVRSSSHGTDTAGSLMRATLETALDHGARGIWLGVNQLNSRAVRFYEKSGFAVVGTRRFKVGDRWCDDFVMQCLLRD